MHIIVWEPGGKRQQDSTSCLPGTEWKGESPRALQGTAVNQLHQLHIFLGQQQPVAVSAEIPVQHHELQHSSHVTSYKLCCTFVFKHKVPHDDKTVVRHLQNRLWVELNARLYSGVTSQSLERFRNSSNAAKSHNHFLKKEGFFPEILLSVSSTYERIQT